MAIYHLCIKTFSRSAGESAVAAAAYRAGERLFDDRLGLTENYKRRAGVLREQALLVLPPGSPSWSRENLWNAAEAAENRKNSTVAREVEVSLPSELGELVRIRLAHDFGRYLSSRYGCAADVQLHRPIKGDDNRNYHSHILLSTRVLNSDGFGEKIRVLDSKQTGPKQVEEIRKEWADRVNCALSAAGIDACIDHRSNARRGLPDAPTLHVGRGKRAAERAKYNSDIRRIDAELKELLAERATTLAANALQHAHTAARNVVSKPLQVQNLPAVRAVNITARSARLQRSLTRNIDRLRREVQQDMRLANSGFESSDKVLKARKMIFTKSRDLYNATCKLAGFENPAALQNHLSTEKPAIIKMRALRGWAISVQNQNKKSKNPPSDDFFWPSKLSSAKKRAAVKKAEDDAHIKQLMEIISALLCFLFGNETTPPDPWVEVCQKQSRRERLSQLERRLTVTKELSSMTFKKHSDGNSKRGSIVRDETPIKPNAEKQNPKRHNHLLS